MKSLVALFLLLTYSVYSIACTTFLLSKNGAHYFGKNYDWMTGNGMVMVNARGLEKTSLASEEGARISWISQFGSITFNQFGKENPNGGMNEKGLVIELMWLDRTVYPKKDQRPAIDVLQWIQYQLDCSQSVEDVIKSDKKMRISNKGSAPLHYLIADSAGNAATIEFLNGRMVVHRGKDLPYPVLSNTVYSEALKRAATAEMDESGHFGDNSIERFATACSMITKFKKMPTPAAPVDYAFSILKNVAQDEFTKWSIVYDISRKAIYFTTNNRKQRKELSLKDFNFSCGQSPLAFDLKATVSGNISASFTTLNPLRNRELIEESLVQSSSAIQVPQSYVDKVAAYFSELKCTGELTEKL